MKDELMPLAFYLLYTEDLKKQSDRIVQEIKSNAGSRDDYEVTVEMGEGNLQYMEAARAFMDRQTQSSKELLEAVSKLKDRIDALERMVRNNGRPDLLQ